LITTFTFQQVFDICHWIAIQQDQIGQLAGFQRPDSFAPAFRVMILIMSCAEKTSRRALSS